MRMTLLCIVFNQDIWMKGQRLNNDMVAIRLKLDHQFAMGWVSLPLQAKILNYKKETIFAERNWKKMMENVSSSF